MRAGSKGPKMSKASQQAAKEEEMRLQKEREEKLKAEREAQEAIELAEFQSTPHMVL